MTGKTRPFNRIFQRYNVYFSASDFARYLNKNEWLSAF